MSVWGTEWREPFYVREAFREGRTGGRLNRSRACATGRPCLEMVSGSQYCKTVDVPSKYVPFVDSFTLSVRTSTVSK